LVKLRTGAQVICQDQFPSKYTGKTIFKWRPAEIVDMETKGRGSAKTTRVKVHFDMWSDRHDIWLDLHTQWDRLGQRSDLSEEASDNARLSSRSRARMREVVTRTTGKAPETKVDRDDEEGNDSPTPQMSDRGGRDAQDSRGWDRDQELDRVRDGGRDRGGANEINSESDNDMIGLAPDPDSDNQVDDDGVGEVGDGAGRSRKLVRKAFGPGYQPEVSVGVNAEAEAEAKVKARPEAAVTRCMSSHTRTHARTPCRLATKSTS